MPDERSDSGDSVLDRLKSLGSSAPRLVLPGDGDASVGDRPSPLRPSSRYEILGEIARGGVGVVFRGRDADLGRDVAMKVLREDHAGSVELTRRFIEEAQVGGQLQHPGIVPVYELGMQPDGRPFFAMKLVKGGTLAAALAARRSPDEDRRRFLAIFEKACQTMAYAHSRGVVHRDLKPSNVMIGAFGEVQVVDWGFAKVLAAGGVADEKRAKRRTKDVTLVETVRSGSSGSASVAGSVMGTPAYMPPEQALGRVDYVDERSDVFSLGAILCEVLTGAPPYVGDDLLGQARRCALDDARQRLDACGADDGMVRLARRCLETLPKDRPKNASEAAASVTDYLAESDARSHRSQLVAIEAKAKAEQARAAAEQSRLAAAERVRARRQARAIAAVVLAVVVLSGGACALIENRRAERARATAAAVDESVQDATRLAAAADWTGASAAAERARELAANGEAQAETLRRVDAVCADIRAGAAAARAAVEQAAKDVAFLARLDDIRARQSTESSQRIDSELVEAFGAYGIDAGKPVDAAVVARVRARGAEFASAVAVAIETWVQIRHSATELDDRAVSTLVDLARGLDDDRWRGRLLDAVLADDVAALREMAKSPEAVEQPARTIALLAVSLAERHQKGHRQRTGGERAAAVEFLRRAHPRHPGDFWINYDVALYLHELGRENAREAVRYAVAAYAIRPDSMRALSLWASALDESGDPRRAVQVIEPALSKHPDEVELWNALTAAKFHLGDAAGAEAAARESVRLFPSDKRLRVNIALAIDLAGDHDRALAEAEAFVRDCPDLSLAHLKLGNLKWHRQDLAGAEAEYREAVRLDPRDGLAHAYLGDVLLARGDVHGALKEGRTATELESFEALGWKVLGAAHLRRGERDLARPALERAVGLGNMHASNQAVAWHDLALMYRESGDLAKAGDAFDRAIAASPDIAQVHFNYAEHLRHQLRWDEALAEYRAAARLSPGAVGARMMVGIALIEKRDFTDAIAQLEGCLEIAPEHFWCRFHMGRAMRLAGDLEGATEIGRQALARAPSQEDAAYVHHEIGLVHWAQWRHQDAIVALATAIEARSDLIEPQHDLGRLLLALGRSREAVGPLREAVHLAPEEAAIAYDLARALRDEGELAESLTQFRSAAGLREVRLKIVSPQAAREGAESVERMIRLERNLDAVLEGKVKPKGAEELDAYIWLGRFRARHAATARMARDVLAEDPPFAEDPRFRVLHDAARSAALAAAGDGHDADTLRPSDRTVLRDQALAWLRAESAAVRDGLDLGGPDGVAAAKAAVVALKHDPALASVRGEEALAKLAASEREVWVALWKDVDALFETARKAGSTVAPK